jgi:hypothetical protein
VVAGLVDVVVDVTMVVGGAVVVDVAVVVGGVDSIGLVVEVLFASHLVQMVEVVVMKTVDVVTPVSMDVVPADVWVVVTGQTVVDSTTLNESVRCYRMGLSEYLHDGGDDGLFRGGGCCSGRGRGGRR